jgi:hypothetical protein
MNEAVQTAVELSKVLGLIIGGLWAAWTFKKLQKARSAELDNNKKLLEQRDLVTRALRQQPQLIVRLCVTETAAFAENTMSVISIAAMLKNEGERNMMIEFGHAPLGIGRFSIDKGGLELQDVRHYSASYLREGLKEPVPMTERILRAGQSRQMALTMLAVEKPTAFIIQFQAVYSVRPFDGEDTENTEPLKINALEQTFFLAAGSVSGSTAQSSIQL